MKNRSRGLSALRQAILPFSQATLPLGNPICPSTRPFALQLGHSALRQPLLPIAGIRTRPPSRRSWKGGARCPSTCTSTWSCWRACTSLQPCCWRPLTWQPPPCPPLGGSSPSPSGGCWTTMRGRPSQVRTLSPGWALLLDHEEACLLIDAFASSLDNNISPYLLAV